MFDAVSPNPITFGKLTHLLLGNFKAFGRTQRMPIRPITLIYGRNNGGKSSIIQALLYAEAAHRSGSIWPSTIIKNGRSVADGNAARLIHGRSKDKRIEFGWEWSNPASTVGLTQGKIVHWISDHFEVPPLKFRSDLNKQEFLSLLDDYDFRSPWELNRQHRDLCRALTAIQQVLAMEFRRRIEANLHGVELSDALAEIAEALEAGEYADAIYNCLVTDRELHTSRMGFPPRFKERSPTHELFDHAGTTDGTGMVKAALGAEVLDHEYGGHTGELEALTNGLCESFADQTRQVATESGAHLLYQWLRDVWTHFDRPLNRFLDLTRYLPAMRTEPERVFFRGQSNFSARDPRRGGASSGHNNDWNLAPHVIEKANVWLKKHHELTGRVEIRYEEWKADKTARRGRKSTQDEARPVTLYLYDHTRGLEMRLDEVGFGLSQFIPVLLACCEGGVGIGAETEGTLLIEEPEAHIHPALQAEIGDLFIDAVTQTDHFPLSYIVCETHSEHVLLRIMRRIREGKVSPDLISVLFVETVERESIVREMPLNEKGELIRDWPGGFFEEGLREVLY